MRRRWSRAWVRLGLALGLGLGMNLMTGGETMACPSEDAPVCCTLPREQRQARREELDAGLLKKIAEVRELERGYALRFEPAPGIVEELARFIDTERSCCSFLDFTLRVDGDGPIWLELTGSAEAKAFLRKTVVHSSDR